MAVETNALLGRGRRIEPKGRKKLRPDTEVAVLALREEARA